MEMKYKLLVFLYDLHISEKGDHISQIAGTRLHLRDPRIAETFPSLIEWKNESTFEKQTPKYALDLVADGLVERKEMEIWLTREGFRKSKELKHPIFEFWNRNWKWLVATVVIGVIIPIVLALLGG